ncbi:hypothetical protein L211DRAFT_840428 [Terfezia boudieri ATCC MYA-4762]|uniref:Uncharacterized protein n=1 Tax=Terfezia boudieri ATCC MYA-4762 TaxID=1051890 RepID=A0A3N4LFY3_9PEZI|nr:hypothetical protein L211DRAFT_840428 [Terfezia boudieri ATCC MYA-4762]
MQRFAPSAFRCSRLAISSPQQYFQQHTPSTYHINLSPIQTLPSGQKRGYLIHRGNICQATEAHKRCTEHLRAKLKTTSSLRPPSPTEEAALHFGNLSLSMRERLMDQLFHERHLIISMITYDFEERLAFPYLYDQQHEKTKELEVERMERANFVKPDYSGTGQDLREVWKKWFQPREKFRLVEDAKLTEKIKRSKDVKSTKDIKRIEDREAEIVHSLSPAITAACSEGVLKGVGESGPAVCRGGSLAAALRAGFTTRSKEPVSETGGFVVNDRSQSDWAGLSDGHESDWASLSDEYCNPSDGHVSGVLSDEYCNPSDGHVSDWASLSDEYCNPPLSDDHESDWADFSDGSE